MAHRSPAVECDERCDLTQAPTAEGSPGAPEITAAGDGAYGDGRWPVVKPHGVCAPAGFLAKHEMGAMRYIRSLLS